MSIVSDMPSIPKKRSFSRAGMCGPSHPARFFKTNRNWTALPFSAGKKENIWNIIVFLTTTGPETADVNVLRKDVSNGKKTRNWPQGESLNGGSHIKWELNPRSATDSPVASQGKCSESINGFESEMACKRCSIHSCQTCPLTG